MEIQISTIITLKDRKEVDNNRISTNNQKTTHALSGKEPDNYTFPVIARFNNSNARYLIFDWSEIGLKELSQSYSDYEYGKQILNRMNLTSKQYDQLLNSLVNFLGL